MVEMLVLLQLAENLEAIRHHGSVQPGVALRIRKRGARVRSWTSWRRQSVAESALPDSAANTLVFDLLQQFEVLWQSNAGVVVPHVAKVTAEHQGSVLWLAAVAEQILILFVLFLAYK